jgi:hypothetical protein
MEGRFQTLRVKEQVLASSSKLKLETLESSFLPELSSFESISMFSASPELSSSASEPSDSFSSSSFIFLFFADWRQEAR